MSIDLVPSFEAKQRYITRDFNFGMIQKFENGNSSFQKTAFSYLPCNTPCWQVANSNYIIKLADYRKRKLNVSKLLKEKPKKTCHIKRNSWLNSKF